MTSNNNPFSPPPLDPSHPPPSAMNVDTADPRQQQQQQPWGSRGARPSWGLDVAEGDGSRGLLGHFFRSMMNRMEHFGREFDDAYFSRDGTTTTTTTGTGGSSGGGLHGGSSSSSHPSFFGRGGWFDDPFFAAARRHPFPHVADTTTVDGFFDTPFFRSPFLAPLPHYQPRALLDDFFDRPARPLSGPSAVGGEMVRTVPAAAGREYPIASGGTRLPEGEPPASPIPTALSEPLHRRLAHFFGGRHDPQHYHNMLPCVPRVDVRDTGDALMVHADLPGMRKEDVKVDVKNGVLTISGGRDDKMEESSNNCYRQERCQSSFYRALNLPPRVKEREISASFDNGVLEVTVPHDPDPVDDQRRKVPIE